MIELPEKKPKTNGEKGKDKDNDNDQALPPLSPEEFKIYNALAERMDMYVSRLPLRAG